MPKTLNEGLKERKYDQFPPRNDADTRPGKPPQKGLRYKAPKGQEWIGDDAFHAVAAKPLKGKGRKAPNSDARRKARRKWARLNGR